MNTLAQPEEPDFQATPNQIDHELYSRNSPIAETSLFNIIKIIVDGCRSSGFSVDTCLNREYPKIAYEVVSQALDLFDLSQVNFTYKDLRFLLRTPFGYMLKRPVLYGAHRDFLRYQLEGEGYQDFRDLYIDLCNLQQFCRFERSDAPESKDFTRFLSNLPGVFTVLDRVFEFGRQIRAHQPTLFKGMRTDNVVWMVDPGHGLDAAVEAQEIKDALIGYLKKEAQSSLTRKVRFSLVDDIVHFHYKQLFSSERGFGKAFPADFSEQFDGFSFTSSEKLFDLIERHTQFPEVVFFDVELGANTLNGIEAAKAFRALAKERLSSALIYCFSANIEKYRLQLEDLKRDGTINDFFPKIGLTSDKIIEAVNRDLG